MTVLVTTPTEKELANFHLLPLPNTLAFRGRFNISVVGITKPSAEGMDENLHASQSPFTIDGPVQAYVAYYYSKQPWMLVKGLTRDGTVWTDWTYQLALGINMLL